MPGTQWGQGRPDNHIDYEAEPPAELDINPHIGRHIHIGPDDWTEAQREQIYVRHERQFLGIGEFDASYHKHPGLGKHRHDNGHIDHKHATGGPILYDDHPPRYLCCEGHTHEGRPLCPDDIVDTAVALLADQGYEVR